MKVLIGLLAFTALAVVGVAGSPAQGRADGAPGAGGSKLAVTRVVDPVPGLGANPEAEIWVMNGDGSEPRQLTDNDTFDLGAVWSPNGKTVAFYDENAVLGPHIYLVDADDDEPEQRPLTGMRSRFPSWSASGKIAFDNGGPTSGDIFVINPDGSGLQPLTDAASQRNIRPDWSPNDQKIAFTTRRDGNDEIYVMNADGSDPVNLTHHAASDNAAAWSPDGKQLVFQSNRDGDTEIYSMNADGSDQTRLTDYPGRDQDADWAPNGRTIAFERDAEPFADRILQVFVMNADGSDERQLTPLGPLDHSENSHPGWGRGPDHTP
jgi:Tol biopolymer transport system component